MSNATPETVPEDPVAASAAYLRAVRTDGDPGRFRRALRELDPADLDAALDGDGPRKAFWLNVYNAVVQETLSEDPDRYEDRRSFYSSKLVAVAGRRLSLDEVEHGILRRSQLSVGLGYVRKPRFLVDGFTRRMQVDALDARIHFALNCGAASCPPVAAYSREGIDEELDLAAESYLQSEVEYDPDGVTRVPRLLLWFRGDFGGRSGIYRTLWEYGPVPEGETPKVKYREYDWSLELDDYR